MDKRQKIGIIYSNDSNWIGGTYYIENLVSSFNSLPEERQPLITVLSKNYQDYEKLQKITGYNDLRFFSIDWNPSYVKRGINKISRRLFGRNIFSKRLDQAVDVAFPNPMGLVFYEVPEKVYWLPDFQHYRLPELFSESEKQSRDHWFGLPAKENYPVVVSSHAAEQDYNEVFPEAKNPIYVLPFAVTLPELGSEKEESETLEQFEIDRPFFLCSNQFWIHKNHLLVLKAVKLLKETYPEVLIVFTGKEYDPRDPEYTDTLKKFVSDHRLQYQVSFLGFIDRKDQLRLMKRSIAIIQPSLFEGWSTVIEDAKSLNQSILASSLPVNKEQLANYPEVQRSFFDPDCEDQLAEKITEAREKNLSSTYDYEVDIRRFAEKFMSVVQDIRK